MKVLRIFILLPTVIGLNRCFELTAYLNFLLLVDVNEWINNECSESMIFRIWVFPTGSLIYIHQKVKAAVKCKQALNVNSLTVRSTPIG